MKWIEFFKFVLLPSIVGTFILTILGYNFPFKGREPLTEEELPSTIVSSFILFIVAFCCYFYMNKNNK